jgi:hypothetical protein
MIKRPSPAARLRPGHYRVEGRQSFYALTRPELMDLLRSAESVLAATGYAVALCPVYGDPCPTPTR